MRGGFFLFYGYLWIFIYIYMYGDVMIDDR